MTPYASTTTVTTTGAGQVVAIPYPGRCMITRVIVVRVGDGSIAADVYSRAFTSAAMPLHRIANDGNGKCKLFLIGRLALTVGDLVTVGSTTVGGYNTTHRITSRIDDMTYVTSVTFTAAATGGTVTLDIPSAEQPLYKVTDQIAGTNSKEVVPNVPFVNQDPLMNNNIGVQRSIYFKFATAATYRVTIQSTEDIGH